MSKSSVSMLRGPPSGCREFDMTESDITESAIMDFDITDIDITESDIKDSVITRKWKLV